MLLFLNPFYLREQEDKKIQDFKCFNMNLRVKNLVGNIYDCRSQIWNTIPNNFPRTPFLIEVCSFPHHIENEPN